MTSESIHFHLGNFSCVALPDVIETLTEEYIPMMFTNDGDRMLAAFRAYPGPLTFCQNVLLVDTGHNRVLIDTGGGPGNPEAPGHLLEHLQAESISPDSIATVVITHFHQDHIGGLLDEAGKPTFPNARLVLPRQEHAYWMSEEILAGLDPSDVARLRNTWAAYANRLILLDDATAIEPGIHYVPALGHSPGHRAVHIQSGDAQLLHLVDTIHMPIQLNELDVSAFDAQPDIAIATRRALLAKAESDNLLLMAYHFPFPGLGYVRRQADQLTWEPYAIPASSET